MHPGLRPLLEDQAGVVSRRQAESAGVEPHELRRLLRRRELVALHAGVYLDHTGRPTFLQRAWGATLVHEPAALALESALRAVEGPGSRRPEEPIHLAVGRDRHHHGTRPGIVLHRVTHLEERVLWDVGPPRMRYEEAALDVAASAASHFAALAELSRVSWLDAVLTDVAAGTCWALEHGYLHRVERAHGLAGARRQVKDRLGSGSVYRDVLYRAGVVVELDGRLFHDTTTQRDRDVDRDLDAAAKGLTTVRVSWGQVFERPCWTAARIQQVLSRAGWPRPARPCGPGCILRSVA